MATWAYADWPTVNTTAGQIARLRQHIAEVGAAIGPSVSADGKSRSTGELVSYRQQLMSDLKALEARPDAAGGVAGGVSYASFNEAIN